ncbi:chymotrypsin-2-like [Phlebotomus argentipes]|uniref:chymotrypsin-2-like n=1 Tax=Phlebotomus argentipes TaxID=94469 RepID=UPI002892AFBB|nr:chymotrypsin-2-like [Phlebotomus argentipes]
MLLKVILFSFSVLAVSSKSVPGYFGDNFEELTRDREGFITGGQDAASGQFPHAVSIRTTANSHFCGGFILTNRWVGTAAHCTLNRTPESVWIIVGALLLSSGGTNVFTNRIVNHPDFYPLDEAGDIGLLETRDPIIFSATAAPILLGSNHIGPGVVATAIGWGRTFHGADTFPDTLQWLTMHTITNEDCYQRLPSNDAHILQDNMVCVLTEPGKGVCQGDSGGALFVGNTAIGVASWIIAPCGQAFPDMFTRISTYYNWLLVQMET